MASILVEIVRWVGRAQSVCDRGRVRVQPQKSGMGLEGGDAAPLSWSANISRFELVEKWGLTPVLKPRQDPRPPEIARWARPLPDAASRRRPTAHCRMHHSLLLYIFYLHIHTRIHILLLYHHSYQNTKFSTRYFEIRNPIHCHLANSSLNGCQEMTISLLQNSSSDPTLEILQRLQHHRMPYCDIIGRHIILLQTSGCCVACFYILAFKCRKKSFFISSNNILLLFIALFRATALILIGNIRPSTWITPRAHTQKHDTTEIDHCL